MVVDERAIIVQLRWVLWSKRARSRSTRYLQISRWQFGADLSIILEFIALRVKARGDTGNPGSVIVPQYGSSKIIVFVWGKNIILKFLGNTK